MARLVEAQNRRGETGGARQQLGAVRLVGRHQARLEELAHDAEWEVGLELAAACRERVEAGGQGRLMSGGDERGLPDPGEPSIATKRPRPWRATATASSISPRACSRS